MERIELDKLSQRAREELGDENICTVIFIDRIDADGDIKEGHVLCKCPVCENGDLSYKLEPRYSIGYDGRALLIASMWAWRCNNKDCENDTLVFTFASEREMREKMDNAETFEVISS